MKYVLLVHGGAGAINRKMISSKRDAYLNGLESALRAGGRILEKGGSALDAVEKAVIDLENNPIFNAGKGSVLTHDGEVELDASIMEGKGRQAGAVCGLRNITNPISAARCVLQESEHVLLSAKGALRFANAMGFEQVTDGYFFTEERKAQLEKALKTDRVFLDHDSDEKHGTVGAVALDLEGNLAAATSTGGLTNKKWGRVGDSPLIGAGTWADNRSCAVSCTGYGEAFIRCLTAYEVGARILFGGSSLEKAGDAAIHQSIGELGATGGLIAVDRMGNYHMPFNSAGMFRGVLMKGREPEVRIF